MNATTHHDAVVGIAFRRHLRKIFLFNLIRFCIVAFSGGIIWTRFITRRFLGWLIINPKSELSYEAPGGQGSLVVTSAPGNSEKY